MTETEDRARRLDHWIVRHYGVPEHWTSFREIVTELQAAEERGRRRGLEERDNALKAAHDYCLYMFKREWLTDPRNRDIFAARIFEILDAAIAPRDSGKEGDDLMRALRDSATVSTRPPTSKP